MITYFKFAELTPSVFGERLVYERSPLINNDSEHYRAASSLVEGQSYTVEELIRRMVQDSDNNATGVLLMHMDPHYFEKVLIDLGIKVPNENANMDFVTAKTYANIFRTLYNASYLNREYSSKALKLMSTPEPVVMIGAGIPAGVPLVSKFGERTIEGSPMIELHECGIVYAESRPYSLCIMTEGDSYEELRSVITDLSALTYQNVR